MHLNKLSKKVKAIVAGLLAVATVGGLFGYGYNKIKSLEYQLQTKQYYEQTSSGISHTQMSAKDVKEELNEWELVHEKEKKPMIMARIVDVKKILSELYSEKEFVLALKIIDEKLYANDGLYMLHCGPLGGNITPIKIADAGRTNESGECCHAECEVTIENLTSFFFGYKKAEECFKVYAKT